MSAVVRSELDFPRAVADEARIHRQLDQLTSRAKGRRFEALAQDGVRFNQLLNEREQLVGLLVRSLADASYRPSTARLARSFLAGKWRHLAQLGAVDMVVHAVVADVLGERLEPVLSPHVYSYRAKRSPWQALRYLARTAKRHRAEHPDPRTRGLFVLRGDIQSYAPTIPLDDASAMWPELRAVCALDERSPHWQMLRALILQDLRNIDGSPVSRAKGVLFGAPTSNALMNLYLAPLDDAFAALNGAYARFGDDVLFAHADPRVVRQAHEILLEVLRSRRLESNAEKMHVLYWNGAARASQAWPEARPVSTFPFLGAQIGFDGTIALSTSKWRNVLADLRQRIVRTARLIEEDDVHARARVLAGVVNEAFDPRSDLGLGHLQMLRELVSDRRQLAQLDYWLALWIAEAASGKRGVRAFREVPYGWLRREAQLGSRVASRNGLTSPEAPGDTRDRSR